LPNDFEQEPLSILKTYPAFQVLRDKAECHQRHFRPRETARLEKENQLDEVLDTRTESCWNTLAQQLANGAPLYAAEEVALPYILLPEERKSPIKVKVQAELH
jgi:hypothetical protein